MCGSMPRHTPCINMETPVEEQASFFSLILYVARTLLSYLSTEKKIRQESDEPVKMMSLTEL